MKYILTMGLSLALTSSVAMAEGLDIKTTIGAERSLETEVNSLYGSLSLGNIELGATFEDTAADQASFNLNKIELDLTQDVGAVTLYMENDFNDDFKHTDTVVGARISF